MTCTCSPDLSPSSIPHCLRVVLHSIFVVSLCDGIETAFVALARLGASFQGIAVESVPALRDFTRCLWPHLHQFKEVKDVTSKTFGPLFVASRCHSLLLIAVLQYWCI